MTILRDCYPMLDRTVGCGTRLAGVGGVSPIRRDLQTAWNTNIDRKRHFSYSKLKCNKIAF